MAKFCSKCGKPLDESGICSCQQEAREQAVMQQTTADQQVAQQTTNTASGTSGITGKPAADEVIRQVQGATQIVARQGINVFRKIVDIFKNPMDATKQIVESDSVSGTVSMIVTNVLVYTLIVLIAALYADSELGAWYDLPVAKITFTVLFICVVVDLLLAACIWISTKFFFREDISFMRILSLVAVKLLMDAVFVAAGSIISLAITGVGFVVFLIGSLFTSILFIFAYAEVTKMDKNKKVYAMSVAMILFVVVMAILAVLCMTSLLGDLIKMFKMM